MRLVTIIRTLLLSFASLFLLAGCNGAAEDTSSSSNDTNYAISLSYQTVVNGQCADGTDSLSFNVNEQFCAVAHLTLNNANISGALVEFTAGTATVSLTTKLTDANGLAKTLVSSPSKAQMASTITAIHTPTGASTVSASRNYEFLESSVTSPAVTYKLTTSVTNSSGALSRFKIGTPVKLNAKLLDSANQAIGNQIITFQAGGATLSPATALTDSSGLASVNYTPLAADVGASTLSASANYQGVTINGSSVYEVLTVDDVAPNGTLKMGHFNSTGQFIEGKLGSSINTVNTPISAGGTFGVTATIVLDDGAGNLTRLQAPTSVNFSSDCSTNNAATLDTPVTTLSGTASATFSDTSCSGNSQRSDQIIANAVVGNVSLTANVAFTLERQTLASLSFVSAEPAQIRIKGSGGTGSSESSLVTFLVTSANGQPAAQQTVDFSLDTIIGGLSFANAAITAQGITNANGLVSIRVQAGTVPTPVRVMASAKDAISNAVITSQSEQLTVNTGLPQQLGFSISSSLLNPEAGDSNGTETTISVYASDSFGNPAPDDTTVNFTAEGGQVQPSCRLLSGKCSVTWTAASPRVSDHRVTILAYALGHETFFDTNGNNVFDSADGTAIANACLDKNGAAVACTGNGMDIETYHNQGYVDLPDAFRDDNESGTFTDGEKFFNTANNATYSLADGKFNGPQCEGALCGTGQANKTYIRKALVLTMSGSTATFGVSQNGVVVNNLNTGILPIANNATATFDITLTDNANQMLPAGTTLAVSSTLGELQFSGFTVPNRTNAGGSNTSFTLKNAATPGVSQVTLTTTTPKGVVTQLSFNVTLN